MVWVVDPNEPTLLYNTEGDPEDPENWQPNPSPPGFGGRSSNALFGGGPVPAPTTGGGGRPPGVPLNFVHDPVTGMWNAPGGGGGVGGPPPFSLGGVQQGGRPVHWEIDPQTGQYVMVPDTPTNVVPEGLLTHQLGLQQLAAQTQYNQQYLQYLQQQSAQNAGNQAAQLAIERERLQVERQNAELNRQIQQQRLELERQQSEFQRATAIQETLANPRSLVQSLLLLGASPAQAAGYLQNLPLVQQVGAAGGTGQVGGWAPPPGGITPEAVQAQFGGLPTMAQLVQSASAAQGGSIDPTTGRNPLFPFISGRALPVQQTLADIEQRSPRIGTLASLFSFSGQNPENAFGEFQSYLPKGGPVGLTSFR